MSKTPKILYRYRPVHTRELASLVGNQIYLSAPESFDDPWDCALLASDEARLAVNRLRIACFATTDSDTRFWSHYSTSHRGICIGYHTEKLPVDESSFHQVKYSDKHPGSFDGLERNSPQAFDAATRLLITKCQAWGPQAEWRMILQQTNVPYLEHEQDAIASITFGLRTEPTVRQHLMNCLGFNPSIEFREIQKADGIMTPVVKVIRPSPDKTAYVDVSSSEVPYTPPPRWE